MTTDKQRIAEQTAEKIFPVTPAVKKDDPFRLVQVGHATELILRALEQGWVNVSPETMPKIGQRVLLTINGIVQHISYVFTGSGWEWNQDEEDAPLDVPSHWMKFPIPPTREGDGLCPRGHAMYECANEGCTLREQSNG